MSLTRSILIPLLLAFPTLPAAQTVLSGDHVITGDLCVGASCSASETFDTTVNLKLKASLLDVEFDDTSGANFPDRDWRLLVNDGGPIANGGIERFSIQDVTANRIPFTIQGDAPSNALVVADDGKIGLGTMLPATDLHILNLTGTASLRLEETAGTPYIWDIRANNDKLYIFDPQHLNDPFTIMHGASHNSLVVGNFGAIGLGVGDPQAALHLKRTNGTAEMLVEELSTTSSPRTLVNLINNGRPEIVMANTGTGGEWSFGAGTNFVLKQGAVGSTSSAKTKLFEVKSTGNATLAGSLTTGGTTCGGGCDRVFTDRAIIPAEDYAAQMWAQGFLPHVGPTPEGAPLNVSEKLGGMLNALEHAHVYIDRQRGTIAAQETRIAQQDARIDALSTRLHEIETRLSKR